MIIGCGIDIVIIDRIARLLDSHKGSFLSHIFSDLEVEKILSLDASVSRMASSCAKRFAAKEAVSKAIGCGIGSLLSFKEIEVFNENSGKPFIVMNDRILKAIQKTLDIDFISEKDIKIHLSLSDEKEHAIAQVIIEKIS